MKRFSIINRHLPRAFNRIFLLVLLILLGFGGLKSQNITQIEYFFDTDPGFGAGTSIPVVTPSPNLSNINHSISISSLPDGFHRLFIRVKDANGLWSLSTHKEFLKETINVPTIFVSAAEYFFDIDPGFGQGIALPVNPDTNITKDFSIDITSLEPGLHHLFVRVKDNQGQWSFTNQRSFLKEIINLQTVFVEAAEYFIDTDPGFGQGTAFTINPDTNLTASFDIGLNSIDEGFHNLFVRVKDNNGRWSLTNKRSFLYETVAIENPNIQRIEYFIDNDPGFGSGLPIPIVPGANLNSVSFIIGISSLENGFHKLFIRAQDENGRWSMTNFRSFLKETINTEESKLVKAEYFIDTDPGFGLGTVAEISPDTSNAELSFIIDISDLDEGFHKLFSRTLDETGKWSHTYSRIFYKEVIIQDTLPNLVYAEYFLDNDPGNGNGNPIAFNPGQNIPFLAFQLDLTGVEFGEHFLFIRTKDEDGKWSLTTRDTIFYYLDSLPTAVLSGPPGVCENATAEFEVSLTGTAPWTLIFDNGFEIDTVYDIMVTPYIFSVSPSSTGTKTAKVLKIQDVYYTGLYTGIPIEYEVYPLPLSPGAITGQTHICASSNSVLFYVSPISYATEYEWIVPSGAIVDYYSYGHNYAWVTFSDTAQSGIISVRGLNNCGYGPASTFEIFMHDLPLVEAGTDISIPYGDSAYLFASANGGEPPYAYSWSPWYYLDNYSIANPVSKPPSDITYTVYVTDFYGCQGSDDVHIDVGPPPGSTINGLVTYDNSVSSPMSNVLVRLEQGGTLIDQTYTNYYGNYSFGGVQSGTYTITASTEKAWGGSNSTDAMQILKHFAQYITLEGLHAIAADLNLDGSINSVDALMIGNRFVGFINSFQTGNWVFETTTIEVPAFSTLTANFKGNCYGDVNGSYIPGAKTGESVQMVEEGNINAGELITSVPVRSMQDLSISAVSLSLNLPEGIIINGVRINSLSGNLSWLQKGSELRISWYDVEMINIKNGEILFTIDIENTNFSRFSIEASAESEIADGNAEVLSEIRFSYPKIKSLQNDFSLGENYPNPFNGITTIPFSIPEEGFVSIQIFNAMGQLVAVPLSEFRKTGEYILEFDGKALSQGMYQYNLSLQNGNDIRTISHKMILNR